MRTRQSRIAVIVSALAMFIVAAPPIASPAQAEEITVNAPARQPAAYGPSTDPAALAAGGYIADQLGASLAAGDPVGGGTLDATMALAAVGVGQDVAHKAIDALQADDSYIYGYGTSYAAMAKVAFAVQVQGIDPRTFYPGHDMLAELRAAIGTDGQIAGTNAFSQALGVLALSRTEGGAPAKALTWLEGRQCTDASSDRFGGYGYSTSCSSVDGDYTAMVAQSLLAADVPATDPAVANAAAYLERSQSADGGWLPGYPGPANTNSAGLATQFLYATGRGAAADRGKAFIEGAQVGCDNLATAGYEPKDVGAIAYSNADFESGTVSLMATAQAVLGLAGHGYADLTATGASANTPQRTCADPNQPVQPPSYGPSTNALTADAASWVGRQLVAEQGLLDNYGSPDWGITLDAVVSLASAGVGADAAATAIDRFRSEGAAWLDAALAGSESRAAKTAYVLLVHGDDPRTFFPDRDLLAELRAAASANGGRFGSATDVIGQAYGILALARTSGGVPAESVASLEAQQCSTGGFGWDATDPCGSIDADSSSLAGQALVAAHVPPTDPGLATLTGWFERSQNADGSYANSAGPWGQPNAQSTGLAGQTDRALGLTEQASRADAYVQSLWLTPEVVVASSALVPDDQGAVAWDPATLAAAQSSGLTGGTLDSIRWTTTQAFLAEAPTMGQVTALGASAGLPITPAPKPDPTPTPTPTPDGTGGGANAGGGGTGAGGGGSAAANANNATPTGNSARTAGSGALRHGNSSFAVTAGSGAWAQGPADPSARDDATPDAGAGTLAAAAAPLHAERAAGPTGGDPATDPSGISLPALIGILLACLALGVGVAMVPGRRHARAGAEQ